MIPPLLKRWLPHPRWGVIAVPYVWLLLFFAIPFLIVLKISFSTLAIAMPPYTPVLEFVDSAVMLRLNLSNYLALVMDSQYVEAYAQLDQDRGYFDLIGLAGRLPDGLRDRAPAAFVAQHRLDAGHPAVVDLVPDPRLRLDRHPQEQGPAQQPVDGARAHR
jgi:ABC-type sugar transport system permease subunit